jgi:hypothetical protein
MFYDYLLKAIEKGHTNNIRILLDSGKLPLPCVKASDLQSSWRVTANTLALLIDYGAIIDPLNANIKILITKKKHFSQFKAVFKPNRCIVSMLTAAIEYRNDEAATLVWNTMTAKQQASYLGRRFGSNDACKWLYEWMTSMGLKPNVPDAMSDVQMAWIANFQPTERYLRGGLYTYRYRPVADLLNDVANDDDLIRRYELPVYIHNNMRYKVFPTLDGEVALAFDGTRR